MGTAWDVHRCARDPRCVPPFTRVSCAYIYLCVCVYTSLDLKDVRMLSATTGPVKLLKDESHGATTASSFPSFLPPPLFEIFEARIRGNFFEKLSLFVSRILFEIDHFQKKRKSSNYHFVQPGNRIILLVNFTIEEKESNLINLIIDSEERITFDQNWNRNIRPRI